jgi:hypothetical protein
MSFIGSSVGVLPGDLYVALHRRGRIDGTGAEQLLSTWADSCTLAPYAPVPTPDSQPAVLDLTPDMPLTRTSCGGLTEAAQAELLLAPSVMVPAPTTPANLCYTPGATSATVVSPDAGGERLQWVRLAPQRDAAPGAAVGVRAAVWHPISARHAMLLTSAGVLESHDLELSAASRHSVVAAAVTPQPPVRSGVAAPKWVDVWAPRGAAETRLTAGNWALLLAADGAVHAMALPLATSTRASLERVPAFAASTIEILPGAPARAPALRVCASALPHTRGGAITLCVVRADATLEQWTVGSCFLERLCAVQPSIVPGGPVCCPAAAGAGADARLQSRTLLLPAAEVRELHAPIGGGPEARVSVGRPLKVSHCVLQQRPSGSDGVLLVSLCLSNPTDDMEAAARRQYANFAVFLPRWCEVARAWLVHSVDVGAPRALTEADMVVELDQSAVPAPVVSELPPSLGTAGLPALGASSIAYVSGPSRTAAAGATATFFFVSLAAVARTARMAALDATLSASGTEAMFAPRSDVEAAGVAVAAFARRIFAAFPAAVGSAAEKSAAESAVATLERAGAHAALGARVKTLTAAVARATERRRQLESRRTALGLRAAQVEVHEGGVDVMYDANMRLGLAADILRGVRSRDSAPLATPGTAPAAVAGGSESRVLPSPTVGPSRAARAGLPPTAQGGSRRASPAGKPPAARRPTPRQDAIDAPAGAAAEMSLDDPHTSARSSARRAESTRGSTRSSRATTRGEGVYQQTETRTTVTLYNFGDMSSM